MKRPHFAASFEDRLAALGERGDDIVVVLGPDGCFRDVSASVLRILGYTKGELVGRAYAELLHPDDLPVAGPAIRDGADHAVVARVRHKHGHYVTLEASACAIRDACADVMEVVGVHRVASRSAATGDLVAPPESTVDDDFNNLFEVLRALADHVRERQGDDDTLPEDIDEILRGVESIRGPARPVSRGLAEKSTSRVSSPQDVLAELGPLLRGMLPDDIEVRIELARHASPVPMYAWELRQLVTNLAKNAQEAMPQGGTLGVVLAQTRDRVTIEISDTGDGMTAQAQSGAARPFFGTKAARAGLGLWVARRHAASVQGTLEIASHVGRGTTVTVSLPSATAPEHVGAALGTNQGRVLVVDDDAGMRVFVARALAKLGYGVTQAADGDEAIELILRDDPFDLVITDVVMPSMGGLDLVKRIREHHAGVPAVYMTGYEDLVLDQHPDLRARVLAKPFTVQDLINTVRAAMKPSVPS